MVIQPRNIVRLLVKAGLGVLLANEVRGLILAGPVFMGCTRRRYGNGNMAGLLARGIALSVFAPLFVARKFKLI
jgi:hypothetical protein